MIIYTSEQVRPYVYMGIHKITGEIYIGYREDNVRLNRTSDIDLCVYRTSSKVVNPKFDEYDWFIMAEFDTGNSAYDFEQQLIFEHWHNPLLINKNCHYGNKKRFKCNNKGRKQSVEHIAKLSAIRKGKPANPAMGAKISAALKGRPKSEEHKKNAGDARKGILHTEETKQKIKEKRASQVFTEESNLKRSTTMKQWWADRKSTP